MKRIVATIFKEWKLNQRDLGGLLILFLMPALLTIIMALVQDGPFKDFQHVQYQVVIINQDQGRLSDSILKALEHSNQFIINKNNHFNANSLAEAEQQIQKGYFHFGIYLPKGISNELVNSSNLLANEIGKQVGILGSLPHRQQRDSLRIQLLFDPVSKPAFKLAMQNMVERMATKIQSQIVLERIAALGKSNTEKSNTNIQDLFQSIKVSERNYSSKQAHINKNSVQHNVPAWAIFGMFFIVVTISEKMISERNSGSWTRLKLIPGSFAHILIGKMVAYMFFGLVQFYFMMILGKYLMPVLGLPSLSWGAHPLALFIVVLVIAFCASAYGVFLGSLFRTTSQALPVAAISVVILSALGGIWVPLEVLPESLKTISVISPLRWSLEAVNHLLLRTQTNFEWIMPIIILTITGVLFLIIGKVFISQNEHT
ncbi:MAG: ABC transporter permease [Chitinophagaceae bacterium]